MYPDMFHKYCILIQKYLSRHDIILYNIIFISESQHIWYHIADEMSYALYGAICIMNSWYVTKYIRTILRIFFIPKLVEEQQAEYD